MARIDTPDVSDDDFAMVDSTTGYDGPAVSFQTPELISRLQRSQQPGPSRLNPDDDAAAEQTSGHLLDGSFSSIFNSQIKDGNLTSYFGDVPGLKYTKSLYKKFSSKDVLIAVMGMTGSGKTTFIANATGRTDLKIGHDLTSCTQEIQIVETIIDGHTVRFVDTPGFSDTYLSDTEVLEMIADYLAAGYNKEMRLSGIIYLHPISDNRVTHHATKNLDMFRKLTGEKNLKNVVLTTSMWDKVTPDEGLKREQELQSKFWNVLMAFGAKYCRQDGSANSVKQIASMFMDNKPFYLQLQEEMGKDNKALKDTAAGKEIMAELSRMKEQHQKELSEMKEMLLRTSAEENKAAVAALEQHYKKMLRDMEKTLSDERRMNEEAVKSLTERISALEKRGICNIM
ncbi:p-loop containing nucleoside triphosphate hydrolase [Trichoderma arundinaceum]|uniref:p-loop containing nucleoside triphosphate hydrolase n=1 Tax=Trichoderma arundinaceum TaxID=490622 RepID=A0A395NHR3_TRIAR|nr:p-loop containing nucleoside triphosphate hydrolase [Trichoderma arundinaceum]